MVSLSTHRLEWHEQSQGGGADGGGGGRRCGRRRRGRWRRRLRRRGRWRRRRRRRGRRRRRRRARRRRARRWRRRRDSAAATAGATAAATAAGSAAALGGGLGGGGDGGGAGGGGLGGRLGGDGGRRTQSLAETISHLTLFVAQLHHPATSTSWLARSPIDAKPCGRCCPGGRPARVPCVRILAVVGELRLAVHEDDVDRLIEAAQTTPLRLVPPQRVRGQPCCRCKRRDEVPCQLVRALGPDVASSRSVPAGTSGNGAAVAEFALMGAELYESTQTCGAVSPAAMRAAAARAAPTRRRACLQRAVGAAVRTVV